MSEVNFAKLTEYDFIIFLDASGSMGETDCPGGKSRWEYMQESTLAFVRDVEKLDDDGLSVVVFGGQNIDTWNGVTSEKVKEVFNSREPKGSTPMGQALEKGMHLLKDSRKKKFALIFTDGEPNDPGLVEKFIRDEASKINQDDDLTFLFVQIGRDRQASRYLDYLDNNLKGVKFDIVCAKTIEEAEKFNSTSELILYAMEH